jgi:hypothetical protein
VAEGGASLFTSYRPTPRITALASQIAQRHPELRVTPQTLDLMGGALPLVKAGYEAIALAGYSEQGVPGSATRLADSAGQVDAEVMGRAQTFVGALTRAIDEL